MTDDLYRLFAERFPGMDLRRDEPMRRHTSFRIGGPAALMAFPRSPEELVQAETLGRERGARPLVIGNGTNLLCPDKGLDRLVICTEAMNQVERVNAPKSGEKPKPGDTPEPDERPKPGDTTEPDKKPGAHGETGLVLAQAGAALRKAAEFACRHSLAGLEFAHGIPGTLGGGVCMNAGAYGGEMAQVLVSARVLFPGEGVRELPVEELHLGYRHSLLTECPGTVVLSALLRLIPGEEGEIRQRMRDLMDRRRKSQPLEFPSAGSAFKRPPGYYAGSLIDQCGLKGLTVGGAQVSEKHAGFLINRGGASYADVTSLIREVQRRVLEQTGVSLEPEIRILQD